MKILKNWENEIYSVTLLRRDLFLVKDGRFHLFSYKTPAAYYCSTKMATTRKEGQIRYIRSFFIASPSSAHHWNELTYYKTPYVYLLIPRFAVRLHQRIYFRSKRNTNKYNRTYTYFFIFFPFFHNMPCISIYPSKISINIRITFMTSVKKPLYELSSIL